MEKVIIESDQEVDPFWDGVVLPHQSEDPEVQFTNAVVTAEWFAEKTATISELGGKGEILEEEIANLKIHLRRAETRLFKLRRSILAKSYEKVTKTADKVIQEAFIIRKAEELGNLGQYEEIESQIEDLKQEIEIREPARDKIYTRLKILKDTQESARQYLDYEKLDMRARLQNQVRGLHA